MGDDTLLWEPCYSTERLGTLKDREGFCSEAIGEGLAVMLDSV